MKKLILFWTIFFNYSLIAFASQNCPSGCICISQTNAVPTSYCDGLGFRSVPQNIASDTEILSLGMNTLHRITDKDFENLTQLRRLSLKMNAIQHISKDAFARLTKLKYLNLSYNLLKTISIKVFENLHSLEELHLNDNKLESLPKALFEALPNLKKLYLQNNNFVGEDESITLSNFENLEYLDLSRNKLTTIRARMFENLPKLRSVMLYDNQIEKVEPQSFVSLPQLTEIMLNNNAIYTLEKDVFAGNISKITLYGNPLRCDCDLYWIYKTLVSSPDMFKEKEKMKCHSPSGLVGKPLVELYEKSFGCDLSVWGLWQEWSKCDKPCGGGHRSRTRTCMSSSSSGALTCEGPPRETESCNTAPCTTGGLLSAWSSWSPCPGDWKNAKRSRKRKCINPFTGDERGAVCVDALEESESCHGKPINGGWSKWSEWSKCSKKCRVGTTTRTRTCTNPVPLFNGALCDGLNIEKQAKICMAALCPPKVYWSDWGPYSECPASCGTGVKTRRRYCLNEFNKKITIQNICPGQDRESISCTIKPCTANGVWSSWLQWSGCDAMTCKRSRIRICLQKGGDKSKETSHCIGDKIEQEYCDRSVCSIHSVWSQWQSWSACSATCGGGIRKRSRECPGERNHRSVTCGEHRSETEVCNKDACAVHYWSNWGSWTKCSGSTFKKQLRRRECIGDGPKQCKGRAKERRGCLKSEIPLGDGQVVRVVNKKCRPRGDILNGKETVTKTANGLQVEYSCNQYYRLKGGPSKSSCVDGKGWSSVFIPNCVPSCGKAVHKSYGYWYSRARLYGGEVVIPHSWPWQVIVQVKTKNDGWKLRCGGSLINNRWIVTASHCLFTKPPNSRLFRPHEVKVYMGVHNLTQRKKNKNVQMSYAKLVVAHPKFNQILLDNDIGLIELETPAVLNDKVIPVCLPTRKQKYLAAVGQVGTVVGWGTTKTQKASDVLKELRLPVIDFKKCVKAYEREYNMTKSMFCAGKETAEDTCKGDSGGGFLFRDPQKQKWTLQGIVSWGSRKCGKPDMPSVYTRVAMFTNWIRKVMRSRNYLDDRRRNGS